MTPLPRNYSHKSQVTGKPRKDARRGRCHPLEAGFWPLWMTPLPRTTITEYRIQVEDGEDGTSAGRNQCHRSERALNQGFPFSPLMSTFVFSSKHKGALYFAARKVCVCVYYCRTYYKAVLGP